MHRLLHRTAVLTALLGLTCLAGNLGASAAAAQAKPDTKTSSPAKPRSSGTTGRFLPVQLQQRADRYYATVWGIDSLEVKYTEGGEMVRFSYRVVDPKKAAALSDKAVEPSLEDPQAGVKLKIPQMDNVGKLRASSDPIAGNSYWMAFSNVGRRVRPGHRVDVVVGHFRASGLEVN
jgi:hypothetical protein